MKDRQRKKELKKKNLYINPGDTWSLDRTIAKFVYPRLKLFKELNNGYPGYGEMNTANKWDAALDEMIEAFRLLAECNPPEPKNGEFKNPDYMEQVEEYNAKIEEGLKLFARYYRCLWW